jgi:apolipoprotein N-acyltransferase
VKQHIRDIFLLMVGAGLYTIAAPPYDWAGAAWFALAPLFFVVREKTPGAAFVMGLLYGVFFCVGVGPWIYSAIAAYFSFSFLLNLLLTLLSYGLFVGLFMGLAALLSRLFMRSRSSLLRWVGAPAAWVCCEYARSYCLFGVSWELLGYTQHRNLTLIQIADVTGIYGVSFLLAFSGYVAAEVVRSFQVSSFTSAVRKAHSVVGNLQAAIRQFPWSALSCLAGGAALVLLYGTVRLHQYKDVSSAPSLTIALVQGGTPSAERWRQARYAQTLLKYASVTSRGITAAQPELIVWPEFAVGFYLDREPLLQSQIGMFTREMNAALLLGAPRMEETAEGSRYYNSAYLLSADGALLGVYDKIHLMPFAEYRPLAFPAFLDHSDAQPSEFTAGEQSTIFSLPRGAFGTLICYEAAYPHLARRLVQGGAQFLVNISNDTWLVTGGNAAAKQHFSMAVFRAVENKRFMARVATDGVSGFIDPTGRSYQLSVQEEGAIVGQIAPQHEVTVYARWGDWFVILCALIVAAVLFPTRWVSRETEALRALARKNWRKQNSPASEGERA